VDFRPFVNGGRAVSPESGVFNVLRLTRPEQSKLADLQKTGPLKVLRRRKMAKPHVDVNFSRFLRIRPVNRVRVRGRFRHGNCSSWVVLLWEVKCREAP